MATACFPHTKEEKKEFTDDRAPGLRQKALYVEGFKADSTPRLIQLAAWRVCKKLTLVE